MNKNLSKLLKNYYKEKEDKNDIFSQIIKLCQSKIKQNQSKFYFIDKDDVNQESTLKIFNMLEKHKLDKVIDKSDTKILCYIKTSIDNAVKDVIKRDYKFIGIESNTSFDEYENQISVIDEISNLGIILEESFERFIEKLTKKQKEVMRLLCLEELTESEIAIRFGCDRQNINSIKNRAKKTLITNLTQNYNGACETPLFNAINIA